ncbi:MAG: site-specific integrase, partial [Actinomycetota bacterium]
MASSSETSPETTSPEIDEFLDWLVVERGRANNTIDAYRRDLAQYDAWLHSQGVDPGEASVADIERFLA